MTVAPEPLSMQVAAGGFHAAALTHEGDVFTWGMGRQGALGHGDVLTCYSPTRVKALQGIPIAQVPPTSDLPSTSSSPQNQCAHHHHHALQLACATLLPCMHPLAWFGAALPSILLLRFVGRF
jgi:alpha-tubulin suppressor-like RCC1 family protein